MSLTRRELITGIAAFSGGLIGSGLIETGIEYGKLRFFPKDSPVPMIDLHDVVRNPSHYEAQFLATIGYAVFAGQGSTLGPGVEKGVLTNGYHLYPEYFSSTQSTAASQNFIDLNLSYAVELHQRPDIPQLENKFLMVEGTVKRAPGLDSGWEIEPKQVVPIFLNSQNPASA